MPAWADSTGREPPLFTADASLHQPDYCPNCGEAVPEKAGVCPACGSDGSTGWSEMAESQRLELPSDDFDYEEFLETEFASKTQPASKAKLWSWIWWMVGIGFILILLAKLF